METSQDRKCDLHIHSTFSDSNMSVEEVFKEAKKANISCLALTDHDTVAGIASAQKYSRDYNIELIPSIELSANYKDTEVHILGHFIDANNRQLNLELDRLKELRLERILGMADRLNALGVKVDKEKLLLKIDNAVPTRLHLGTYLLEAGRVNSLRDAFKKYLSPNKPAYINQFKYSAKEAIAFIKNYGGLAFLAHPHLIFNPAGVEELVSFGLDGLEVVYPTMSSAKSSLYENMTIKFNLLRSGGSDAHGSYKKFNDVGIVSIPYSWVEEMKKCLGMPIT